MEPNLIINHNKPLVMHIDLNSCFATVTQQAFPHLRGKPLVMAAYNSPRGCVLAPSIEAKRYGIKTGMRVFEARLLYKDVIVRTTDVQLVRDIHMRLKKITRDYSTIVIPKSIDEVIIDFNPVVSILNRSLTDIALEIKQRIRKEIGEWMVCSVGIGTNRFLAKTGASLHKPDGLDVINHQNLRDTYSKLKLIDLCGINQRYQARLNIFGIFTPLQFLDAPLLLLKNQVFQSIVGYYWYKRLRGYEVDDIEFKRKSYGQDYALGKQTSNPEELSRIMMKLCEKMGRRLRKSGQAARGIHVAIIYNDYTFWHRSRLMNRQMYSTFDLFRGTQLIFNQQPERKVVAKISVSCYDLSPSEKLQMSLFDQEDNKKRKVLDSMDNINNKYGELVITPALMLGLDNAAIDRIAFGGIRELEDLYSN
jgi:DNA polymerase-4